MSERTLDRNPLALLSLRQQLLFTLGLNTLIGLLITLLLREPPLSAQLYSHCIGFGFFAWIFGYSRLFRFRLATVWLPLLLGGLTGLAVAILLTGLQQHYSLHDILALVRHEQEALFSSLIAALLLGGLGFYLLFTLARAWGTSQALQQARILQLEADKQLVQAQLRLLQAQIEPHFLFNTLSTIAALIDNAPQQGKAMLEHFTRYLRATLRRSRTGNATLGDEMELIGDYLELLQMRLGERLRYRIEIPAPLRTLAFPPMLLQPLVENAIRHGIEPTAEGGDITIDASAVGDTLHIRITDSGGGLPPVPGTGLGLANIRERLHSLYGEQAKLTIYEHPPHGVRAAIEVPYGQG